MVVTDSLQSAAGLLTYFVVMGESGFMPYTLIGLSTDWNDPSIAVQDSFGQDWVRAWAGVCALVTLLSFVNTGLCPT